MSTVFGVAPFDSLYVQWSLLPMHACTFSLYEGFVERALLLYEVPCFGSDLLLYLPFEFSVRVLQVFMLRSGLTAINSTAITDRPM